MADSESIKEIVNQVAMQQATCGDAGIQKHWNRTLASHNAKPAGKSEEKKLRAGTGKTKIQLGCTR